MPCALVNPFAACIRIDLVPEGEVSSIWLHSMPGVEAMFTNITTLSGITFVGSGNAAGLDPFKDQSVTSVS
jgi:hypothetical protein